MQAARQPQAAQRNGSCDMRNGSYSWPSGIQGCQLPDSIRTVALMRRASPLISQRTAERYWLFRPKNTPVRD